MQKCFGCFGSGRFSSSGSSYMANDPQNNGHCFARRCIRCDGTGYEPRAELDFVAEINARVAARKRQAA